MDALMLVVDAANVVGSRPDGWWRDRAGATRRLAERLARLAEAGLSPDAVPGGAEVVAVVLVVEGAARHVEVDSPALSEVAAPGSGDDEIVRQVDRAEVPVLVVTADRGLRERVERSGASCIGPGWLLGLLDRLDEEPLPPIPDR